MRPRSGAPPHTAPSAGNDEGADAARIRPFVVFGLERLDDGAHQVGGLGRGLPDLDAGGL